MSIEESPVAAEPAESVDGFPIETEAPILEPKAKALPVDGRERVGSVDVIRGFALMGILAMNIVNFGWPGAVYSIPIMAPDSDWADLTLWGFNHLVFDTKMMTLFSMLFGAGLVLMSDRATGRGARMLGVYYRRVFWLLMIGLVHSYLIWAGDILVLYGSCGLLLYPVRKWSAKTLIIVGLSLNFLLVPLLLGFRYGVIPYMRTTAERVEAEIKEGKKPSGWNEKVRDGWKEMSKTEMPKREDFLKSIRTYRGSYWGIVKDRAKSLVWGQTLGFVFGGWWFIGGRMLIGMGLMKLGVFSAARSRRTYQWMMGLGYGIGLPLMLFDAIHEARGNFYLGSGIWHFVEGWPLLTFCKPSAEFSKLRESWSK